MTGLVLACVQQYCQIGRSSAGLCSAVLYLPYVH